jgi:hypothetical protein
MRALARRFTADQTDSSGTVRRLRLLPQPIYRYADETGESLDGGIFAMVRVGDLEIILIIDATKAEDGPGEWRFDCMPVSVDHQVVQLDGNRAWERQRISFAEAQVPRGTYYLFMRAARAAETAEAPQR